jgi:head-tail adaptor
MLGSINIGEMDVRLRIEGFTTSNHAVTNQEQKSWTLLKTIWGKELGPLSKETFEANQQVAVDETRFLIRGGAAFAVVTADSSLVTADSTTITADNFYGIVKVINEKMRLIRRGETFFISSVEGSGRRGFAIIKAVKRDNG